MTVRNYRDLLVWQKSMDLVMSVYGLTSRFPKQETYGLSSQMQRAAVSIPANIAEGHDRDSTKEYLHSLAIAVGSLAELETLLAIARRLTYLDAKRYGEHEVACQTLGRMLRNLQRALRARVRRKRKEGDDS
ncbi:MAG TPA: four helix bundle protein [Pirellulaceae bacterium]|nr:four helix bundle protein [Pirellulaceae bacterium]